MKYEQEQDELGLMYVHSRTHGPSKATKQASAQFVPFLKLSRRKRRPSLSARGRRTVPLKVRREAPRLMMLRKLTKLRKMVPGSQGLDLESLLIRTSEYISLLKWQVNTLECLWSIHSR